VPSDSGPGALAAVAGRLRCPSCGEPLLAAGRALSCAGGHSFDIAREGHVALPAPRRKPAPGDTPAMVAAREAFLAAGHYRPIADAIVAAARSTIAPGEDRARTVVDLGAGTGYYLAALLGELPDSLGVALDASRPALRRALRAHPRIAAIACDVWAELPLQDATADLILDVFAPRNGHEIARVLAADGALIVASPTGEHLHQLVSGLGMLSVDAAKQERLHATLGPGLSAVDSRRLEFDMMLGRGELQALVAMGPSAHHLDADDLRERLARLSVDELRVSASVNIETFRRAAPARPRGAPQRPR
jgi:23S rRNA (guanine745-N1)-methyltransferase